MYVLRARILHLLPSAMATQTLPRAEATKVKDSEAVLLPYRLTRSGRAVLMAE